jgi:protein arginine N-methyltransferase 1
LSLIVDEHREYLADAVRVDAFRKAIEEVVTPGDVVLDLASGTGILGLIACRAGAGRVYSVEVTDLIGLAREISRVNGFAERHRFIKGMSLDIDLPEKVDVVVCDQIGRLGPEFHLIEHLSDVRTRFLKPGGVLIPCEVSMWIAPVEFPEMWNRVEFWNRMPAGFDFFPAGIVAANTGYPVNYRPENLLSSPVLAGSFDLNTAVSGAMTLKGQFVSERQGILNGIGGWFSARLSKSVTVSNSPLIPRPIKRRCVFFPLERPVDLAKGNRVDVQIHIRSAELMFTWTVDPWSGSEGDGQLRVGKGSFCHSTFRGMLLSKEAVERTHPDFVPRLTARGQARRTILELCDGKTPLAQIEAEVYRRHNGLFRSYSEAAAFVAEVTTRYAV